MALKLLSNEATVMPDGPLAEDVVVVVVEPPHATMTVPSARRRPPPPRRLSPSIFTSPRCCRDVDAGPPCEWGRTDAVHATRVRSRVCAERCIFAGDLVKSSNQPHPLTRVYL